MSRISIMLLLAALAAFLIACGGKGTGIPTGGGQTGGDRTGNQQDPGTQQPADDSDLEVVFVSATPEVGPTPMKVDFLAVVRGGIPPYNFYWDFTNDGAADTIANQQTVTTAAATYTYPFLQSDAAAGLNQSTFTARFWVTDSRIDAQSKPNPAQRISDPVTIVVTSGSSFVFDPTRTGIVSQSLAQESISWKFNASDANEPLRITDFYTFKSGEDIRFNARATEGVPPYKYRWNFDYATLVPGAQDVFRPVNQDFRVDSTIEGPHISFSYNDMPEVEEEANYRLVLLQAVDSRGNSVQQFIGIKIVPTEFTPPPPPLSFKVFVTTEPPVTLDDDPAPFSAGDIPIRVYIDKNNVDAIGMPIIPSVHFSAAVSTNPAESGTPPYFYYWDFEGDGLVDSKVASPTVPFWNAEKRAVYNPYRNAGDYVCKLTIKDGVGVTTTINIPVRVEDVTGQNPINVLKVTPFAYPKDSLSSRAEFFSVDTDVVFNVEMSGGTPPYTVVWDRDYDGLISAGEAAQAVIYDPADTGLSPEDKFLLLNFEAGQLTNGYYPGGVRVTDSAVPPTQVFAHAPVSITELPAQRVSGGLEPRSHHGMSFIGGDVYMIGGFVGNVALQLVERVRWGDSSYAVETSRSIGGSVTDMPTPRGGLAVGQIRNHIIAVGGTTNILGNTGAVETMLVDAQNFAFWVNRPIVGSRSSVRKNLTGLNMAPATVRLNFGGTIGTADADGFLVCGGREDSGSVSATSWFFLPHEGWPNYDPAQFNPSQFDFWLILDNMITPRYDFAMASIGDWVFTIGGITADGKLSKAVEAFNTQNFVWVAFPQLPDARAGAMAISHAGEDFIGVYGGYNSVKSDGSFELAPNDYVFSTSTGAWSRTENMQQRRAYLGGTVINQALFAQGGVNERQAELPSFLEVRIAP